MDYADYFGRYNGGYDKDKLELKGILSVVGTKIGTTKLILSCANGYTAEVEIEIVTL